MAGRPSRSLHPGSPGCRRPRAYHPHEPPLRILKRCGGGNHRHVADGKQIERGELKMLVHWIWLSTRPHVSDRVKVELVRHFQDPEAVYYADAGSMLEVRELGFNSTPKLESTKKALKAKKK